MGMQQVIFGLGSNCQPRRAYLHDAIRQLEIHPELRLQSLLMSQIYESPALLPPNAPAEWDVPYLNMVVCAFTVAQPRTILAAVKGIETALGRKARGWWGPREIDIDILALGQQQWNEPDLVIPHKEMLSRDFVMVPLADVLPRWQHPLDATRRTAADHARERLAGSKLAVHKAFAAA